MMLGVLGASEQLHRSECGELLVDFAGAAMAHLEVYGELDVDEAITLALCALGAHGFNYFRGVSRVGGEWLESTEHLERDHGIRVCVRIPPGYVYPGQKHGRSG